MAIARAMSKFPDRKRYQRHEIMLEGNPNLYNATMRTPRGTPELLLIIIILTGRATWAGANNKETAKTIRNDAGGAPPGPGRGNRPGCALQRHWFATQRLGLASHGFPCQPLSAGCFFARSRRYACRRRGMGAANIDPCWLSFSQGAAFARCGCITLRSALPT